MGFFEPVSVDLFSSVYLLLCRVHQRGYFCFSLRDVSHSDTRGSDVLRRAVVVDRYVSDRTAYAVAVGEYYARWNLLPVRVDVHPLHAYRMEADARDGWQVVGRY